MKKILVIEDDLSYQKLLYDQLTGIGYEVILAKNGKEGLKTAKSQHPDLIILDIKMPVMDGLSMIDVYREDPYGRSANVIILTNLDPDNKILQSVLKNLPTCYFIKSDIQLAELINKIKDLIGIINRAEI